MIETDKDRTPIDQVADLEAHIRAGRSCDEVLFNLKRIPVGLSKQDLSGLAFGERVDFDHRAWPSQLARSEFRKGGSFVWNGSHGSQHLTLRSSRWLGAATFELKGQGEIDLTDACFRGETRFAGFEIRESFKLENATFEGPLTFERCKFYETSALSRLRASGPVRFINCSIHHSLEARIECEALEIDGLSSAASNLSLELEEITASSGITIERCTKLGGLNLRVLRLDGPLAIRRTQPKSLSIVLEQGVELETLELTEVQVDGPTMFQGLRTSGDMAVRNSNFEHFGMPSSIVGGHACFSDVSFRQAAAFTKSKFPAGVEFNNVTAMGTLDFSGTSFSRRRFAESVTFDHSRLRKIRDLVAVGTFTEVAGVDERHPEIVRGDLAGSTFHRTDVGDWSLRDIEWSRRVQGARRARLGLLRPDWLHKGKAGRAKAKETRRAAISDFVATETNYRQLRLHYEDSRDFRTAGYFSFAEFDQRFARELASRSPWALWTLLYKATSGYGYRPLRAALVLLAIVGSFTWLFANADSVKLETDSQPIQLSVREAAVYSLEAATFRRPIRVLPANSTANLARLAEGVLALGQAGFLGLAIRRSYRR